MTSLSLFTFMQWRRKWQPTPVFLPGESQGWGSLWAAVSGVAQSRTRLSDFTFTFHFHALEKEMATHTSVLAWRIPGTAEPGGLLSMGSHRVGHDQSGLAAAARRSIKFLSNRMLPIKEVLQQRCCWLTSQCPQTILLNSYSLVCNGAMVSSCPGTSA